MGLKFRKSIKIAPGVKINLGKKSAGLSIGGKHGGISFNSKSGVRTRMSIPGTGLSYSQKIGGKTASKSSSNKHTKTIQLNATLYMWLTILLGYLGIHRFYRRQIFIGIIYLFTFGVFGIGWIVDITNSIKIYNTSKQEKEAAES